MQKQSSFLTALWFIPLLAILLAVACVGVYWFGKTLLNRVKVPTAHHVVQQTNVQAQPVETAQAAPVVPLLPIETSEEEPVPDEVINMQKELEQQAPPAQEQQPVAQNKPSTPVKSATDTCVATTVPAKIKKPSARKTYTPYERGLRDCKKHQIFPCAWVEQTTRGTQQYWLMSAEGPITRGVYDTNGSLIRETIATVNGTVTSHTENNITWYFQAGILIKIRTTFYDNCNLHDWFFINENGKQDVCQCAYSTPNCCARSPYKEGMSRRYCDLFPSDKEFCK